MRVAPTVRAVYKACVEARFEIFDHTADMGMRVFAPTMWGLIIPATEGLYSLIGELVATPEPHPWNLEVSIDDPGGAAFLLHDYLENLLFEFECQHCVAAPPIVLEFSNQRLEVDGPLYVVDHDRSIYHREVKAITYHDLAIRHLADGYEATIIVDI